LGQLQQPAVRLLLGRIGCSFLPDRAGDERSADLMTSRSGVRASPCYHFQDSLGASSSSMLRSSRFRSLFLGLWESNVPAPHAPRHAVLRLNGEVQEMANEDPTTLGTAARAGKSAGSVGAAGGEKAGSAAGSLIGWGVGVTVGALAGLVAGGSAAAWRRARREHRAQ